MKELGGLIKQHNVTAFFAFAFIISWTIWISVRLFLAQKGVFHPVYLLSLVTLRIEKLSHEGCRHEQLIAKKVIRRHLHCLPGRRWSSCSYTASHLYDVLTNIQWRTQVNENQGKE